MGTVTGITPQRAQEIEDASVVSGHVSGRNLYLVSRDGAEFFAGVVVLDPIEVYFEALNGPCAADVTLATGTPSVITPTLTVTTPADPAVYLVRVDVDVLITSAAVDSKATVEVELVVDGVANTKSMLLTTPHLANAATMRYPLTSNWLIPDLATGAHTFRARAERINVAGTTAAVIQSQGTQITVLGHDVS